MLHTLLFLLLVKHFLCDFALQGRFPRTNDKHKLTSRKGHLHALDHAIGTALVFCIITIWCATSSINFQWYIFFAPIILGVLDYIAHFKIDWLKNNFVHANEWSQNSREFWILTSIDQILHALTYLVLVIVFDIYFI
jgi:hypothetical protein